MDDLISRTMALDAVNHICPVDTEYDCTLLDRVDVRCVLLDLPSADAVEVVRCEYCDFWNDWDSAGKDSLGNHVCSCAYWTKEDGPVVYTADTDFCSNGDRRRDEDEID